MDPAQTTDITKQKPVEAQQLQHEVSQWERDVLTPHQGHNRPFTVGYPPLPSTQLPARDATMRGRIQRSSRHFNSTYFTNWTSTEDAIIWDVEVACPGRFQATVYYTCPTADVGSLVELRLGDQACRARVTPAFDPPLTASHHDRLPRDEGDMKAFMPLELGELTLSAGRGDLMLQVVEIPGEQVMDFRLLVLTRLE